MSAETDLDRLLGSMAAGLDEPCFVFATLAPGTPLPADLDVAVSVREEEGLTVVVPAEQAADQGLEGAFPCARITLQVHSALDAVGFLAVVTTALADAGISANAVAGFHHDHLFVPWPRREEALRVLHDLARRRGSTTGPS